MIAMQKTLVVTVSLLLGLGLAACDLESSGKSSAEGKKDSGNTKEAEPQGTVSQENALRSAESYIAMSGFSEAGLIEQLSSKYGEGYPKADAIWAVNHLDVDWNQEAVQSAKAYLDMSGFSRAGLIQQLSSSSGDQFTRSQAVYAANQVGL